MLAFALIVCLSVATITTSFVSGILGMAGGMILMGVLLVTLPVAQAMVLHGITQLASNAWRAAVWRPFVNWRCVAGFAAGAALAFVALGSIQVLLGRAMVLIALGATPFLVYLLPRRLELNVDRRGHSFACGVASTSIQILSGVSGPLLDSFFVNSAMDRKSVVATKAGAQTLGHAAKTAYFGSLIGSAHIDVTLTLAMIACAIVGTTLSRKLLERMSDTDFRVWTRRAVLCIGGVYLVSGIWAWL